MGTRLYVGNLPFTADESQLRDLFAQSGRAVSEVKLVTDRDTGRPRGFGFVEIGSAQDADGAIRDLNGYDFGGRALTVNEARERSSGGGGGFGGGAIAVGIAATSFRRNPSEIGSRAPLRRCPFFCLPSGELVI